MITTNEILERFKKLLNTTTTEDIDKWLQMDNTRLLAQKMADEQNQYNEEYDRVRRKNNLNNIERG